MTGLGADAAIEDAGAQAVQEAALAGRPLDDPHGAGVAVRQDRLRAGLGDDGLPALGDQVQRGIPGDPLKAALALRPEPAHRVEQAVRTGVPFEVLIALAAEP